MSKITTLDDLFGDYEKDRLAEIERDERERPEWIKRKIEAEREREIAAGIRNPDGSMNWERLENLPESEDEDEDEENED